MDKYFSELLFMIALVGAVLAIAIFDIGGFSEWRRIADAPEQEATRTMVSQRQGVREASIIPSAVMPTSKGRESQVGSVLPSGQETKFWTVELE